MGVGASYFREGSWEGGEAELCFVLNVDGLLRRLLLFPWFLVLGMLQLDLCLGHLKHEMDRRDWGIGREAQRQICTHCGNHWLRYVHFWRYSQSCWKVVFDWLSLYLNDIWKINLSKVHELTWEELKPKGKKPCPRHGHTMNTLYNYLIVFGGHSEDGRFLNDVFIFNITEDEW